MVSFDQITESKIQLTIDVTVFNDGVVAKTLYWIPGDFYVFWKALNENLQHIILEKKNGKISGDEFYRLKTDINQSLIDFKTRDIINQETKDIRNILYIKAFANGEDFEDYNLIK